MIRRTGLAVIDQALMSALNFALALVLIRYAPKAEYGIYSQLLAAQWLVSPIHIGVFVSAVLALIARKQATERLQYRIGMARAELVLGAASAIAVMLLLYSGSRLFAIPLDFSLCAASAAAVLGLWWREFTRQLCFASLRVDRVLMLDSVYAASVVILLAIALAVGRIDAATILWICGFAAIAVSLAPLLRAATGGAVDASQVTQALRESWQLGRWDTLGSAVTWCYSQSYVYLAAIAGGAAAAAEIAAARLLGSPLSLVWAAYANILRPTASQALDAQDAAAIRSLILRSIAFVIAASALYATVLMAFMSTLDRLFFKNQFHELTSLTILWTAYYTLTGISTVASSVLRSAMQFAGIFWRQALTAVAALALLSLAVLLRELEAIVLALVVIEAVTLCLLFHRLRRVVSFRRDTPIRLQETSA